MKNLFKNFSFFQLLQHNQRNQQQLCKRFQLQLVPQFQFSRFGSPEKKLQDFQKQLNGYIRKCNYNQMVLTQIKIIKTKEKYEKLEFYKDFQVDYRKLCQYLILKRDYEEAVTLYEDCIAYLTDQLSKQKQDHFKNDEIEQLDVNFLQSELISFKLDLASVQLISPNKNGDEAFEIIEELKEYKEQGKMSQLQVLKHILLESKLYFQTYELQESLNTILQADAVIEQIISQDETNFDFISLLVEIYVLKIKLQVELQQIALAQENIQKCEKLIDEKGLADTHPQLCFLFYQASIDICQYTADLDLAQTRVLQMQQILENSENKNPVYQCLLYYYDSLIQNQIGKHFDSIQSLNSCFEILSKSVDEENELVWKALNLKAIQLIEENDFKSALKILNTNQQEMEKKNKIKTRLYYETQVHIIVLQFALTNLQKATQLCEQYLSNVEKHFGQQSEQFIDGLIIQGMCVVSNNQSDDQQKTQGYIGIRQACMAIKNNKIKQLKIRFIYLNLLKEVLKRKNAFKEIFYINTVLNSYFFQPRLKFQQKNEQFIQSYEDNNKQLDLISQILELETVNKQMMNQ
ncbi:hypothetical protein TTHERM_00125220 (macronuclear) [Tetrahymena thermophila SB210]|uniref:Tetratricopeptide repeat protein n=1 Tax=Tetrahymena thermophila (strain SB210) TaxID=312017 RepID=I7M7T4_TETTS|nr:hypothetical protein TTHERM_00125220 [Tetrahymena thermophila SB210]EAR95956.2 hypothetical protein TTHERM_00125220 [Tetrahymena thermophila SB210]|eukprot:XP_001016201.2 hypothetical protein TTHERM_00125220 [Tetrahymena thermophila SB210]